MSESLKQFLEFLSKQSTETSEKVSRMSQDELISFAAQKGFKLTPADFEKPDTEGEIDLDEADAVAGGGSCACVVGGGGTMSDSSDAPACACVMYGQGKGPSWAPEDQNLRCVCPLAGGGCDCAQEGTSSDAYYPGD